MFKLIKLAVYGLLGYALYEFFRGISTQTPAAQPQTESAGQRSQSNSRGQSRSGKGNSRRGGKKAGNAQWSGPGEGQQVQTEEASGEGAKHIVGRGVVSR